MSVTPDSLLVAAPVASMYLEPDPLSEHVSQALIGMEVIPLDERGPWTLVRTPDTYEGWLLTASLVSHPDGWTVPGTEIEDIWANLRAQGDYRSAPVTRAFIGCRLPQVGEKAGDSDSANWVELLTPDGQRLWTEGHRVRAAHTLRPVRARAILRTARRFLGVPYLWGGASPQGLDCSGFVQLVMRLHGISILRDASQQFEQGAHAPEPAAADLCFFGPVDQPKRITHVGMMLDGHRFIHASGGSYVKINALREERYSSIYRGVRRFL